MYFVNTLSVFLASATIYSQHVAAKVEPAQALRAPIPASQDFTPIEEAGLERRGTCPDGGQCLFGQCCGTGCSPNCCAHDDGGIGCNVSERCQFDGNVFVGCCNAFFGSCTGEATRITVHSPADSTMVNTNAPATSDAITTTTNQQQTRTTTTALAPTATESSDSSSAADSTSRSAGSRTPSAAETRSTSGSSGSSGSARETDGGVASSTNVAQSSETSSATTSSNAAPMITGFRGLEMGAVAVGALLAL